MQRHFVQELDALKKRLIKMGGFAEQGISDAITSLLERRVDLAEHTIARDPQINDLEVEIDDAVVDLLALQQPVAADLRFIVAALKINTAVERIGDHAVNIAESARQYALGPDIAIHPDIPRMAEIAKRMLRNVIDGFIHNDPGLCRKVLVEDDEVDDLNRKVFRDLASMIRTNPESLEQALELMRVSRNLERVADLATNIAEDVIFMAEAHVVKHHHEQKG
jgi:phosphate transport system protein